MKCGDAGLIFQYVAGELSGPAAAAMKEHVRTCRHCSRLLELMRTLKQPLPFCPSPRLTSRIMLGIEKETIRRPPLVYAFLSLLAHPMMAPVILTLAIVGILTLVSPRNNALVRVTFSVPLENARSVALVGDFNQWNPEKGRLQKEGRNWSGVFLVLPGRYQYMLIVDDRQWLPDPSAKEYIDDGYGNRNSLLDTARI